MKILRQILRRILAFTDSNNDADIVIKYVQKHYKYLILIFVLAIIYISNPLIYGLEVKKQNRLEEQLLKVRTKYNVKLNEFNEFHSYRNIIDLANKYGLNLEEPSSPPLKVEK
jgi:cell division protein FtsL